LTFGLVERVVTHVSESGELFLSEKRKRKREREREREGVSLRNNSPLSETWVTTLSTILPCNFLPIINMWPMWKY
jgi:hypothetical protein